MLLAATVFGLLVTGLIGAFIYGRSATATAGDRTRAIKLADEGIQAVTNIRDASFGNLTDSAVTVGDTTIEPTYDNNGNGTSAYKVTTGSTGGNVASIAMYIKTVDATNQHIQAAVYADSAGTPGARLGASSPQVATANSWNILPMNGLTVAPNTNYWLALSEDGQTQFAAYSSGGSSAYRVTNGYPAPDPFAADAAPAAAKMSFYINIGTTYGLSNASGIWAFSGSSDSSDIFTRQLAIATTGTNRKTVTSTVSWPQPNGGTNQVSVITLLTNWIATVTTSWANAILAGSADTTTSPAAKTKAVGNYSYTVLSGTTNNFVVTNISNASAPSIVSTITLPGTPTNIAVSGNYAYITNTSDTAEFQVVNISNPAAPSLSTSLDLTGTGDGQGVYVSGNYAYVTRSADSTTGANEFTVINITTPTSPTVVGGYNNNITMYEVYVAGNYAYVATASGTQEMLVINISNPASPTLTATYNPTGLVAARTVTGSGNMVYLGVNTTLHAINVSNPAAPTQTGTLAASGIIYDAEVDATGHYVFLATGYNSGEFQVDDVSTPSAMTLAKAVDLSGNSAMGGVGYDTALDTVAGAGSGTTQEILVFTKN